MVFQLLVLGGRCAEKGAPRLDQVRAVQVKILVNEEVLLFRSQRDGHVFVRKPEALHQLLDGVAQCLAGAQQRSLLIQRVSRIGTVGGRDAERGSVPVPLDEGGAGGSQAVYPRASKVQRRPPEGKLDASGSLTIRFLPEKLMMGSIPLGSRKESCFSAVEPVMGWNQCV